MVDDPKRWRVVTTYAFACWKAEGPPSQVGRLPEIIARMREYGALRPKFSELIPDEPTPALFCVAVRQRARHESYRRSICTQAAAFPDEVIGPLVPGTNAASASVHLRRRIQPPRHPTPHVI